MCLKESCFPDCWKASSVKLVIRLVDHLKKCCFLFYFQYGFRSSRSTADFMLVVSDAIPRAFDNSGST